MVWQSGIARISNFTLGQGLKSLKKDNSIRALIFFARKIKYYQTLEFDSIFQKTNIVQGFYTIFPYFFISKAKTDHLSFKVLGCIGCGSIA